MAGHAPYLGIARTTKLDSTLWATDELTGLIMAVAYVRPSKDIRDVEISSVKKKWKDKLFAAALNRQDIEQGAAEARHRHLGARRHRPGSDEGDRR